MKKNKYIIYLLFLMIGVFALGRHVEGMEGFYYNLVFPENQMQDGNYFDLFMEPGQKQRLIVQLHNTSLEDMKIQVDMNDATTTSNGMIDYSKNDLKHIKNFQEKITNYVTTSKEVYLPKGETKNLYLMIQMPNKKLKGVILGGVTLHKVSVTDQEQTTHGLENKLSYTFSISLHMDSTVVATDLSIPPVQIANDKNQAVLEIYNNNPKILKKMNLSIKLCHSNTQKIVYEDCLKQIKMAPCSILEYPICLTEISPGIYNLIVKVEMKHYQKTWEQTFEWKYQRKEKEKTFIQHIKGEILIVIFFIVFIYITSLKIYKRQVQ